MRLPHGKTAHGIARQVHLGDPFGMIDADIRIDPALVDAEKQLVAVNSILQTV